MTSVHASPVSSIRDGRRRPHKKGKGNTNSPGTRLHLGQIFRRQLVVVWHVQVLLGPLGPALRMQAPKLPRPLGPRLVVG